MAKYVFTKSWIEPPVLQLDKTISYHYISCPFTLLILFSNSFNGLFSWLGWSKFGSSSRVQLVLINKLNEFFWPTNIWICCNVRTLQPHPRFFIFAGIASSSVTTGRFYLVYVQGKLVQVGFLVELHANLNSFNTMALLDISQSYVFTETGV